MAYFYEIPFGGDPNDPNFKRLMNDVMNQRGGNRMPPPELLNNEHYVNQIKAQTAMIVADIRQTDSNLFRNALAEIRAAMGTAKISDGDKGSTERPPIDSSFDDINMGKLQEAYLNIVIRYVKYIDTISESDLGFSPPKSLTDQAKAKAEKKKKS